LEFLILLNIIGLSTFLNSLLDYTKCIHKLLKKSAKSVYIYLNITNILPVIN